MQKTSLSEYLELTNSKRIKRTVDEIDRGLDAEAAAKERLATFKKIEKTGSQPTKPKKLAGKPKKHKLGDKGRFTICCHPAEDCDPEYLDFLTGKEFNVVLDSNWFSWFCHRIEIPYEGDAQLMLEHLISMGMVEIITSLKDNEDLKEHIRLLDYSTIQKYGN